MRVARCDRFDARNGVADRQDDSVLVPRQGCRAAPSGVAGEARAQHSGEPLAAAVDLDVDVRCVPASPAPTLASLRRDRRAIVDLCRRHGASNPRVFGSVLTGLADDDSDIDLLVDLEAGRTLFDVAALHDDLVELLHREVDVVTAGAVRGRLAHLAFDAQPL